MCSLLILTDFGIKGQRKRRVTIALVTTHYFLGDLKAALQHIPARSQKIQQIQQNEQSE